MLKKFFKLGFIVTILLLGTFFFLLPKNSSPTDFQKISFVPEKRGVASDHGRGNVRGSVLLYKLKETATDSEKQALEKALQDFDIQVEKKSINGKVHFSRAHRHQGTDEDVMAQTLKDTGAVEFAEPDRLVNPHFTPNDTYFQNQWHHPKINSPAAWDSGMGSPTVTVASCDTGVDATNGDLSANLISPGYNSEDGASTNLVPVNPHGTMTIGTMAAVTNNNLGVSGVAGNVRILAIRISNAADGSAYVSAITNCIEYAADHGAKVVNLSYGGTDSSAVDLAAQYLRSKGGLLVVSAGNEGNDISTSPDFNSFVMVGATDSVDNRASWSNYGSPIDMVAPGVDILTTTIGGYAYGSGTSFSAPLVSGAAALIYSVNPNFTPSQVEQILFSSARRLGSGVNDPYFGNGILDTAAAVAMAKNLSQAVKLSLSNLPAKKTTSKVASISYSLSPSSSTYKVYCRLDSYSPILCPNPFVLGKPTPLTRGTHKVDYYVDRGSGIVVTSPEVSYSWTVSR